VVSALWVVFCLLLFVALFTPPLTTLAGFSSADLPSINDEGDTDCGGSSLDVVLHGPRIPSPDSDLRRLAEEACRSDARSTVWISLFGLVSVAATVLLWVRWFRRHPVPG